MFRVTATMSTELIEIDAINSSNFSKSDRAFIKEIFGSIVFFVRSPMARLGLDLLQVSLSLSYSMDPL